jgi:hypothetical protein
MENTWNMKTNKLKMEKKELLQAELSVLKELTELDSGFESFRNSWLTAKAMHEEKYKDMPNVPKWLRHFNRGKFSDETQIQIDFQNKSLGLVGFNDLPKWLKALKGISTVDPFALYPVALQELILKEREEHN